MPHVAFCITELDSGGAERALARIATGLHERGRRVSVVALAGGGELVDELRRHGIETDCLGLTKWNLPVVFARLVGRWRRDRPDVVQSFLFHGNIIGRIAARAAGVGVVCSGIRVAERRGRMRLLLDRLTDRLVDRHVCVSRAVAEDARVRGGLPASKLVTIPNGVDLERYESASPIFPRDLGFAPPRFLLWAGRLDPQKDPQLAIEIFAAVASGVGDVGLLMVGEGPLRPELEAMIAAKGLRDRVALPGRRDDLPTLYRSAEAFLLTSRWEGMPNVVLEAMASGCPVVAADVEGVRELLGDADERGTVVSGRSPQKFAKVLSGLLNGSPDFTSKSTEATRYVRERHSWDGVFDAYVSLFEALLDAESRPSRAKQRPPS